MITVDSFIEVTLKQSDDFLKVKETLTRIGIASEKNRTLYQSCHILHKKGLYYIVHFKELFALDGKPSSITDDDLARRNTIANLLSDWGLVNIVDSTKTKDIVAPMRLIKIIPYKQKNEWQLITKYNIGRSSVKKEEDPSVQIE